MKTIPRAAYATVPRPSPGRLLAVATIAPGLLIAGWLLAGLPLLLAGWFTPPAGLLVALPGAVLICWYGVRRRPDSLEATPWQVVGVVAVVLGYVVFAVVMHGEQIIVRRDPATYVQFATWIADHGGLPIPFDVAAFGGPDPLLRFDSMGVYAYDGAVVPQFMAGLPMIESIGQWLSGTPGMLIVPPILGGLAVLVFAGVVARLVGPRWAPLGALALAICLPLLWAGRSAFSEVPAMILLLSGIGLLLDGRGSRRLAGLAGLLMGLATVVRIDGLRDVLPVLACGVLLVALRRPHGGPLLLGLGAGVLYGFIDGVVLARPYLDYLSGSLRPLIWVSAGVIILTLTVVLVRARVRLPTRLPDIAAGLTVLIMLGFAVRPWLQTVRQDLATADDRRTALFIARAQQAAGLPIDPARTYDEMSLYWVIWYVGVPTILLATLGAAVLVRRQFSGIGSRRWLLPLAIIGWTTVTTLWRPAITPDHPWASRRLIPVVIPGVILLAVWALRWVVRRAQRMGYRQRHLFAVAAFGALLILVPPAVISAGTAFTRVEQGEVAAVRGLCDRIGRDAAVLIVERVTGDRFTQVVRGMCHVPVARVRTPEGWDVANPSDVGHLIERVHRAGRRPVMLGARESDVAGYGVPVHALHVVTRQDEHALVDPPNATWSLTMDVWLAKDG